VSIEVPLILAIPLTAAFILPVMRRCGRRISNGIIIGCTISTLASALLLAWKVISVGTVTYTFGAADPGIAIPFHSAGVPIRILFVIDPLSACMIAITAIMMAVVILFTLQSDADGTTSDTFYPLLFLMIVGIFGMVQSGDLYNFFIFLELNSLAGAALVATRNNNGLSIEGGLKYAFISAIGGVFLLFAIGMLYGQYNSLNMAYIASVITPSNLSLVAFVLIVTTLVMKAGAAPMHFWKPDAYSSGPPVITALLIVSSMASLYAIARITMSLYGTQINMSTIGWCFIALGILSMIIGVSMAVIQGDIMRLIAYHSISQIGYMLTALGICLTTLGDHILLDTYGIDALYGGIYHIVNYTLYNGLLFLVAGTFIYWYNTNSIDKIKGVGKRMKISMIFYLVAVFSVVGIPPFNGYASKKLMYESFFAFNPIISAFAIFITCMSLIIFTKVFIEVVGGESQYPDQERKELPDRMIIGMSILAVLIITIGLFSDQMMTFIIEPAARALIDQETYILSVLGENHLHKITE